MPTALKREAATTARQGRDIAFRVVGDGPMRTVWIGGTNVSGGFWEPAQARHFGRLGSCLLADAAGTGRTDPLPAGHWTAEEMARDVVAAMDAAGWEDAHVIGHSLGSVVAWELAQRWPARVRSLSLHSVWTAAGEHAHVRSWFEARRLTAQAEAPELSSAYAFFLVSPHYLQANGLARGALEQLRSFGGDPPLETKLGHYEVDLNYTCRTYESHVSLPTLVSAAEYDFVIPPYVSREVAEIIPGSTFVLFRGAGHLVALEDPEQFNAIQERHLSEAERCLDN